MDWGKSFTYVFDDKDWPTKVLIGGVLSMIPVVNLVAVGYGLKALKNAAEGSEHPLPTWDDFADYFVKGLISVLATFVWSLPIVAATVLVWLLSALTGYDYSESSRATTPFLVCLWSLSCMSGIYGLFLAAVLPAALAQYAVKGDFGAFFHLRDIFRFIARNLGNYVLAILLAVVAAFISQFGVVLCCIGITFTEFWATLVGSNLLGQVYHSRVQPTTVTGETQL